MTNMTVMASPALECSGTLPTSLFLSNSGTLSFTSRGMTLTSANPVKDVAIDDVVMDEEKEEEEEEEEDSDGERGKRLLKLGE